MKSEELALRYGLTLKRKDGSKFNASGVVSEGARDKPAPPPAPSPESKIYDVLAQLVGTLQATKAVETPVVVPPPAVSVLPAPVIVQPVERVSWRFEFERNPDKTIKAIIATPTKE